MQIGNYNFDLNMSGWMQTFITSLFWTIVLLIGAGIIFWIFYGFYKKKIYNQPVTMTKIFQNGTTKDYPTLKGGMVKGKGGIKDYAIIIPKTWKKKKLGYVPDFTKADSDGRLHFVQIGDGVLWQQTDKVLHTEKFIESPMSEEEIEEASEYFRNTINESYPNYSDEDKSYIFENSWKNYLKTREREYTKQSLLLEPLPTDIKMVTINAIHDVENITIKNRLTAFTIGVGAFIIMAIVQIAFLYFTRNR